MGNFAPVLEGISRLEGVQGAWILSLNGEILESFSRIKLEAAKLISLTLKSMKGGKEAAELFGRGDSGSGYIEYQNLNITLESLPEDRYLVVIGKTGTNLGRIRYEIKRSKKLLEEIH